jgi:plasmid stability protein
MPSVTIRDVPEPTRHELAARAARTGRSLQEYLRQALIELADRPSAEDWAAQVRERKRHAGGEVTVADILSARDAERP